MRMTLFTIFEGKNDRGKKSHLSSFVRTTRNVKLPDIGTLGYLRAITFLFWGQLKKLRRRTGP